MSHVPCNACGSSDAGYRYPDGHFHCHKCGAHEGGSDPATYEDAEPKPTTGMIHVEVSGVPVRSIRDATAKVWRYGYGEYQGERCQVATYCDDRGRPVAQKLRFKGKRFQILGDAKRMGLYGQHLWRDGGKMVVITEGELDALSVSQAQNDRWPVVSLPNGAQGAAKAIAGASEWLEKFEKVVLMFDDDEVGKAAAETAATVLSPGKAYIATIRGFKDANDALKAGDTKAIVDAMWGAKPWRPDAILSFDDVWQRVMSRDPQPGFPIPHSGVQASLDGLRPGEITVLVAGTKTGKSTMAREWAAHLVQNGVRLGYIGLEDGAERTVLGLASVLVNRRLFRASKEELRAPDVVAATEKLRASVMIYDDHGVFDVDNLVSRMRFLAVAEKVQVIVLDHLTIVTSGGELENDERRTIDKLMTELVAFVKDTRVHVLAIAHLSRQKGTPHEDGARITLSSIRGSHGIPQLAWNIVALERNLQATGPDADVSLVRVLGCRETGRTGVAGYVRFHTDTGRQLECDPPAGDSPFDDTGDTV